MIESQTIAATDIVATKPIELQTDTMIDYTQLSIGQATRELLSSDTRLQEALNSFTSIAEIKPDKKKLAVLLPGLVVSSQTTYESVISNLRTNGYNTVSVDYSDAAYSRDLTRAQLKDFLGSKIAKEKDITLVGMSMGAGTVIDTLGQLDDSQRSSVKEVVLLGAIYSDEDIKNGVFGKAFHIANRLTPDALSERFAPLAKRLFALDPKFAPDVRGEIMRVSNQALIDRLKSVGQSKPIEDIGTFPQIDAVIGWWEDDYASNQARESIEDVFPKRKVFAIPGHHSWIHTGSSEVNAALAN